MYDRSVQRQSELERSKVARKVDTSAWVRFGLRCVRRLWKEEEEISNAVVESLNAGYEI